MFILLKLYDVNKKATAMVAFFRGAERTLYFHYHTISYKIILGL